MKIRCPIVRDESSVTVSPLLGMPSNLAVNPAPSATTLEAQFFGVLQLPLSGLLQSPEAADAQFETAQRMMAARPARWDMEREQIAAEGWKKRIVSIRNCGITPHENLVEFGLFFEDFVHL